ncbi:hypothetical protein RFI_38531 [Reticulomyxa filosa]|uniref:Uncharacterized protein n=1 Tax=Reticulomyxa filosa TaxID=46433 RepID=X6LCX2_RETFI|nr:hypothetical protein RFI_38531 [Reticulomyxa filosa]|eukprot:ETN98956.1 hypothetical protein RFI_38531 [Reticulomyxa filosa]
MNKMITPFFQNNSKAVMITNRYMKNNDKKIYHLVDNFKMTSHDKSGSKDEDNAQLKLVNDIKVKSDIVFVGILKWCKSEVMKCLSKEKSKPPRGKHPMGDNSASDLR